MTDIFYRIFISYAREDARDIALRLYDDLSRLKHTPWLDTSEIAVGGSWSREIENAIETSDIVIALLTTGSYVSDICRSEQLRALRKGKRVIPVLLQSDADRPLHLENLSYLDCSTMAAYDEILDSMVRYLVTGKTPGGDTAKHPPLTPLLPPRERTAIIRAVAQKRDSRAFRRYIADLRDESWLGERHWWSFFLFYYADAQKVAQILQAGKVTPEASRQRRSRLSNMVALYFRPRTPDLFGSEGIRVESDRSMSHCPIPVYLLFDLEALLMLPESRFSEGDVATTGKTYKSASSFRDMPFDLIYHDGPFHRDERDEIISARRAQVFVPEALDLRHLRHIWCRSEAERETLCHLLPEETLRDWSEKITARTDYELFNRKWTYVSMAAPSSGGALFQFHPDGEGSAFDLRFEITPDHGDTCTIDAGEFSPVEDFALDLTPLDIPGGYSIRLYLDDVLAYAGRYTPEE